MMSHRFHQKINRCVLVPGFSFSKTLMKPLAESLKSRFQSPLSIVCVDTLLALKDPSTFPEITPQTLLIGFSLGGLLSLPYHQTAAEIWMISSSPCFVETPDFPGISPQILQGFERGFDRNPEKIFLQFLSLQGPEIARPDPDLKRHQDQNPDWKLGLKKLKETHFLDLSPCCPIRFFWGEKDQLLPTQALSKAMPILWPNAFIYLIKNAGHAFLKDPELLWNALI